MTNAAVNMSGAPRPMAARSHPAASRPSVRWGSDNHKIWCDVHHDGCVLRRFDGKAWAVPILCPLAMHICKIGLRWLVPGVGEIIFTFRPRWEGMNRKSGGAQLQGAASGACASLEPCCCSPAGGNLLKISEVFSLHTSTGQGGIPCWCCLAFRELASHA